MAITFTPRLPPQNPLRRISTFAQMYQSINEDLTSDFSTEGDVRDVPSGIYNHRQFHNTRTHPHMHESKSLWIFKLIIINYYCWIIIEGIIMLLYYRGQASP